MILGLALVVLCNYIIRNIYCYHYARQLESRISESEKLKLASFDCIPAQSSDAYSEDLNIPEDVWKELLSDLDIQQIGFDEYPMNCLFLLVVTFYDEGEDRREFANIIVSVSGELYITFHDYRYFGYSQNLSEHIKSKLQ